MRALIRILAVVICFSLLAGCGYSIKKSMPVSSVRLGEIENRTSEAKLQDRFREILTHELMKNGIRVSGKSEHEIHGFIGDLKLKGSAEAEDVTVVYEVTVGGSFFLRGPDGEDRPLKSEGEFIVDFSSSGELSNVMSQKEIAIRKALEDIAEELVDSLIHD
jgi:hypothetical protein